MSNLECGMEGIRIKTERKRGEGSRSRQGGRNGQRPDHLWEPKPNEDTKQSTADRAFKSHERGGASGRKHTG